MVLQYALSEVQELQFEVPPSMKSNFNCIVIIPATDWPNVHQEIPDTYRCEGSDSGPLVL